MALFSIVYYISESYNRISQHTPKRRMTIKTHLSANLLQPTAARLTNPPPTHLLIHPVRARTGMQPASYSCTPVRARHHIKAERRGSAKLSAELRIPGGEYYSIKCDNRGAWACARENEAQLDAAGFPGRDDPGADRLLRVAGRLVSALFFFCSGARTESVREIELPRDSSVRIRFFFVLENVRWLKMSWWWGFSFCFCSFVRLC